MSEDKIDVTSLFCIYCKIKQWLCRLWVINSWSSYLHCFLFFDCAVTLVSSFVLFCFSQVVSPLRYEYFGILLFTTTTNLFLKITF